MCIKSYSSRFTLWEENPQKARNILLCIHTLVGIGFIGEKPKTFPEAELGSFATSEMSLVVCVCWFVSVCKLHFWWAVWPRKWATSVLDISIVSQQEVIEFLLPANKNHWYLCDLQKWMRNRVLFPCGLCLHHWNLGCFYQKYIWFKVVETKLPNPAESCHFSNREEVLIPGFSPLLLPVV